MIYFHSFTYFSSFIFHLFLLQSLWFLSPYYLCFFVLLLVTLGVKLGFFYVFSVSWGRILLLQTSLLELLCCIPYVWVIIVMFSLSFISRCFLISLWLLQWSIGYLVTYCLASMCLFFIYLFIFVFFFFFLTTGTTLFICFTLQYCIGFAIYPHESATGMCLFFRVYCPVIDL